MNLAIAANPSLAELQGVVVARGASFGRRVGVARAADGQLGRSHNTTPLPPSTVVDQKELNWAIAPRILN